VCSFGGSEALFSGDDMVNERDNLVELWLVDQIGQKMSKHGPTMIANLDALLCN
jgi:hypothetical protein